MNLPQPSRFRTLLVLGRVSNLPTVWSNCLAGWWLAGGGSVKGLFGVMMSVTFLYLGGMFLNDAFDADFDRNHRRTRPIPSGLITEKEVWRWGFAWLVLGFAGISALGWATSFIGFLLVLCILLYNAIHKIVLISLVFMGGCRLLVYLAAASVGWTGVDGEPIWKGLALACYVIGLSCMARKESAPGVMQYWPSVFLAAPLVIAALTDNGSSAQPAAWASVALVLWIVWTLFQTFGREHPNVGRAVSRLLAGIVLVDLLAVADFSHFAIPRFGVFFLLALLLQRFISAT
jgi:4-hydroxybenzoate polyprenyltransferase